ncbi:MAG: hypothetical protein H6739_27295 [Alphaproteobacteria bacterium]|nr:hypothetical protein [Alphaproteobacteria bacterium]
MEQPSPNPQPAVSHHLVFPTRVTTIAWPDTEALNADLLRIFDEDPAYHQPEHLETADNANMLDLCDTHPAVARLRDLFIQGLRSWMEAEGIDGQYTAELLMFPVYSLPQQFVPAHNHLAHVSAVYYVRTDDFSDREVVERGDTAAYFRSDGGVLLLHDPRFNALLMDLAKQDAVKIFPRPGLMVLMPGYLWHSGLPNYAQFNRLAIVGDFILREHATRSTHAFELAFGQG